MAIGEADRSEPVFSRWRRGDTFACSGLISRYPPRHFALPSMNPFATPWAGLGFSEAASHRQVSALCLNTYRRSQLHRLTVCTLRCTQKLLRRLNAAPVPEPVPPSTVLGDWYANLVRIGRLQVVLAVSERTLLPVVVPAKDGLSLVRRISEAAESMLGALGVPEDETIAERHAMQDWVIGKTASRSILGSMNDFALQLQFRLTDFPDQTLLDHSLRLAHAPMKALEYESPDHATVAAFATHRALGAARRR